MEKGKRGIPWPKELKRTKPRERVLAVFETADKPLTALEVYALLERSGEPVWLSTIYRTLEVLVEKSVLTKAVMGEDKMASYELSREQHIHYAVCLECHKLIPMKRCQLQEADWQLAEPGFRVTGHKLEVYGYCRECE